jgi:hypothetical protein
MYFKRDVIGGFVADFYWSSSDRGPNYAWMHGFNVGLQIGNSKDIALYVRPVRAF